MAGRSPPLASVGALESAGSYALIQLFVNLRHGAPGALRSPCKSQNPLASGPPLVFSRV